MIVKFSHHVIRSDRWTEKKLQTEFCIPVISKLSHPVYHRPISYYVNALAQSDFAIEEMGEWCSHKTSQPGPRSNAENYARSQFPMFLAIRAKKLNPLR